MFFYECVSAYTLSFCVGRSGIQYYLHIWAVIPGVWFISSLVQQSCFFVENRQRVAVVVHIVYSLWRVSLSW